MDADEQAGLVRALASLTGRTVTDAEVSAIVALAGSMTAEEANSIWRRNRSAPHTVPNRHRLAMTLRFIMKAKSE